MKEVKELKQWLYPGAKTEAIMSGAPMVYTLLSTPVPIEKVCAFYREKAAKDGSYRELARHNEVYWGDQTNGGSGLNGGVSPRQGVSVCLYVVRQEKQTVTVQVSRHPEIAGYTRIVLIGSAR